MFSIVIPSKNPKNLVPCVESLLYREPDLSPTKIDVVDDGLGKEVKTHLPEEITWVTGVSPFIFARNVNLGIKAAKEDSILILNDDTLLETPGGFSLLAQESKQHPEFGVISSSTDSAGVHQFPRGVTGIREAERVVSFVCVFIPRSVINLVGLLDERFTEYGWDDNDYCHRVTLAGLKLGVADCCFVNHTTLNSSFRGGPNKPGDIRPGAKIYHEKYPDEISKAFL